MHHATKEIPPAFATGEAAGIAAVQALRASAAVQGVDVGALQAALRAAGAWLPVERHRLRIWFHLSELGISLPGEWRQERVQEVTS